MSNVTVQKIESGRPVPAGVLEEIRGMFDAVQKKAFELFEHRGGTSGSAVEDWIQAERDLFWVPQAEITETETEFKIQIGVPGFEPNDVHVTAEPGAILVRGKTEKRIEKEEKEYRYSEFGEKSLYRRFELGAPVDIEQVEANVTNGMLTVVAPKQISKTKVATAA